MDKPFIGSTRELLIGVAIIGVVVMTVTAAAEPVTISSSGPNEAEPGTQVTVSYTLTNTGANESAHILDLSLPANWSVVSHTGDGGTWKSADNSWLWQTIDPGDSVTPSVTLEVPSDATPGDYSVNGTVKSDDVEAVNNHTITVEQQETASPTPTLTSTSTPTPTPTHTPTSTPTPTPPPTDGNVSVNLTISETELAPGETFTVEPTLTNTGNDTSGYILDLSLPTNWTIVNRTNDGGTWKPDDNSWLWQTIQPNDSVAPSADIEVPDDATNRTYDVEATGKSTDGNATVARSIAVQSTPSAPPTDKNISVNLTVSDDELDPGETVTIEPALTNTRDNASAYILDLSLPANWTIVNRTNDGGTWKPNDNSWLWQTVQPDDSVAPSVTLEAPSDAGNRTYDIEATGKSTDGNKTVTRSVTVQSNVTTPPGTGSGAAIAPFSQTAVLAPNQLEDDSLSGKIRAEESVASNTTTSVGLLRASATNYSIAVTAPDDAENVTFYLQAQAISASQDIEDVRMLLDGQPHPFTIVEDAGSGNSSWIAFIVPEFSTRTVTFTTESDSEDTAPSITAPSNATYDPNSSLTIGTSHNATGVIDDSDVAIRMVNVTAGNDTQVALNNNSVPVEGSANTTIPAGALAGNVRVETQLYNLSNGSDVASDTISLTANTTDDGGNDSGGSDGDDGTDGGNGGDGGDGGDGSDGGDGDTGTPSFAASGLDPQNVTVTPGDTLTVTATIDNIGDASGTQTVEYRIGGTTMANATVTLSPGENTTVEFTDIGTTNLVADDYEHGIFTENDSQIGTLTVEADTGDGTDDSTPGFGSVASLLAFVLFVLLTRRERD